MAITQSARRTAAPGVALPQAIHDQLTNLRWLSTMVPALAVFLYESFRHQFFDHHATPTILGNAATGLVALAFFFAFSQTIFTAVARVQRNAVDTARRTAALAAAIEERERLSRELHDGLAQATSYVLVRLDTIRNLVEAGRAEPAVRELELLRGAVDDVNSDVREAIAGLRSRVVERGLVAALSDYLDEFEERSGIATAIDGAQPVITIDTDVALQIFRIVQEALANVRKHANASMVHVSVTNDAGAVTVTVSDDGKGLPSTGVAAGPRGYGLAGMRERASSVGGICSIEPRPEGGTIIRISVPAEGTT